MSARAPIMIAPARTERRPRSASILLSPKKAFTGADCPEVNQRPMAREGACQRSRQSARPGNAREQRKSTAPASPGTTGARKPWVTHIQIALGQTDGQPSALEHDDLHGTVVPGDAGQPRWRHRRSSRSHARPGSPARRQMPHCIFGIRSNVRFSVAAVYEHEIKRATQITPVHLAAVPKRLDGFETASGCPLYMSSELVARR